NRGLSVGKGLGLASALEGGQQASPEVAHGKKEHRAKVRAHGNKTHGRHRRPEGMYPLAEVIEKLMEVAIHQTLLAGEYLEPLDPVHDLRGERLHRRLALES